MKTQTELTPIESLKEEFFARYGVNIDVQVWVHDAPQEKAEQIAKDYSLTSKTTLEGDRLVHKNGFHTDLNFDLFVIEKGDE